jgi:hypothetical protein
MGEPEMVDASDGKAGDADSAAETRINALLALPDGGQSLITIATAESLTGGNVSARITAISGSSGYFLGGIVAYSNAAKVQRGEGLAPGCLGGDARHSRRGQCRVRP